MATKKAITVPKNRSTAMATIDAELANEVALLKKSIAQPSGNRITVKPTGNFILPDGMDLGDNIQVVVLDFASANRLYIQNYDPNNISPPDCFAIGKILHEMAPDPLSPQPQSANCSQCPLNAFGSSSNGRGKACKNSRELAVLLIDPDNPESANDPGAPIYTMSLPPKALKSFDGAVGYVMRTLNAPPVKAVLTVTAVNVGTYAQISFIDPVPNPDYAIHMARRSECESLLFRKPDYAAAESKPKNKKTPVRPVARPAVRR